MGETREAQRLRVRPATAPARRHDRHVRNDMGLVLGPEEGTSRIARGKPAFDESGFVHSGRPASGRRPVGLPVQVRAQASARAVRDILVDITNNSEEERIRAASDRVSEFKRARAALARDLAVSSAYVTGELMLRPAAEPGQDASALWLAQLLELSAYVGIDVGLGPEARAALVEHDSSKVAHSMSATATKIASRDEAESNVEQSLKALHSRLPGGELSPPSKSLEDHASKIVQDVVVGAMSTLPIGK